MNWNEIFSYSDGNLIWERVNRNRYNKPGDIAGRLNPTNGYLYVKVNQEVRSVHNIIWEMHNGKVPDDMEIDHINHIRTDNRIENLRIVSHQQNAMNMSKTLRNTSGVVGVSWCKMKGKWYAYIKKDGVMHNLGRYTNFEDAALARASAEKRLGFHENHGS